MSDQLDERRDRYAAAMAKRDGHEWPPEFEDDERDYRRRADAVIAVADGEITRALDAEASNAARYLFERDVERDENAHLRVAASSAPADQNLRDRIRRAICEASGFTWLPDELMEPDEYGEHADAVLAVLAAPADRAADDLAATTCSAQYHGDEDRARLCIRAAQHAGKAHTDEHGFHWSDTVAVYPVADGTFRAGVHLRAQLRRMADEAQQAGEGAACRTPETHNWGCGCPSDAAAAIASCLGYETSPNPCRCPCYGCKHHCGAHDPGRRADEAQTEADRIVARRSAAISSVYCTTHGTPEMTPLTSDDLPDGAHCRICGTDVLIPQAGEGR